MGHGTPSVAPQKAKGAVPQSPRVETPQRSRSAERSGDRATSRVDTPPRSRSAERDDRRDGGDTSILQPTPIAPATLGWLDAPIETSNNGEEAREPPETSAGLGPIVIGGAGRPAPDPPQESESRTSSFSPLSMASRAISAIRGIGRSPQPPPPRRGRSADRPTEDGTESRGDSSERSNSSDVYYDPDLPRVVGRGRTIPTPPTLIEEAFEAGVQAGMALQAQQAQRDRLYEELDYDFGIPMVPRPPLPQGEPEPEMPGGGTDPSESDDTGDQGDGSEYPDHTDTDPYESSQAEVEQTPDLECIDIGESPDESYYPQGEEETSTKADAPQAITDPVPSTTPESTIVDEDQPEQPTSRASMSGVEAFTGSISQMSSLLKNPIRFSQKPKPAEPKKDQTPEKQTVAMTGEESAPQVETSEAAPSQETQNESSNPQQGEGESSSTSQAAPAETSASSAQEAPKSSPAEQQPPREKKDSLPSSVPKG